MTLQPTVFVASPSSSSPSIIKDAHMQERYRDLPIRVGKTGNSSGGLLVAKSPSLLSHELEGAADEHTCRTEVSDECSRSLDSYDEGLSHDLQHTEESEAGSTMSPANTTTTNPDPQVVAQPSSDLLFVKLSPPPKEEEEDSEEDGTLRRSCSILKRTQSEPLFIKEGRGAWKRLPPPDMEALQQRRASMPSEDVVDIIQQVRHSNSVVFKDVQIRSYDQTLGDNPSVSYGMPIQLGWEYEESEPMSLDAYEDSRGKRRTLRQMILSYYHRRNVLIWQYGFTEEELKEAKKQTNKAKQERAVTRAFLSALPLEAALESAGRKAKRMVRGSGSS